MRSNLARTLFAGTALTVIVAIVLQIPSTASDEASFFSTPGARIVNLFFYFTIVMNLLVAFVTARLARSDEAPSAGFAAVWTAALAGIIVTAIAYRVLLAGDADNQGIDVVTDTLFHVVVPLLAVGGWLAFGPRGLLSTRTILWSSLIPLTWIVVTLIRGEMTGYYPYPFMDVALYGYPSAFAYLSGVAVFYFVVATGVTWADRRLGARAGA